MNWKLWSGAISAGFIGTLLFVICFKVGTDTQAVCINLTVLAVGATSGWLFGIVLSPYDVSEQKQFSAYAKAASVFISGYLIAKIDKVVEHIFTPVFLSDPVSAFRTLGFIGYLLLAMIVTSIFRRYA